LEQYRNAGNNWRRDTYHRRPRDRRTNRSQREGTPWVAQLTQSLTSLGRIGVAFDGGPSSTSVSPSVVDLFPPLSCYIRLTLMSSPGGDCRRPRAEARPPPTQAAEPAHRRKWPITTRRGSLFPVWQSSIRLSFSS
jgi:hypothetical protein